MNPNPSAWLNRAVQELLEATVAAEQAVAARDAEIVTVQQKHNHAIAEHEAKAASLHAQIEQYYRAHRKDFEVDGKKSVQLSGGLVGLRAPTNPALLPLSAKWTWARIGKAVKRLYKDRFFHQARPSLAKDKLKRELTDEQLAAVGLMLAMDENFFVELNRLAPADELKAAA